MSDRGGPVFGQLQRRPLRAWKMGNEDSPMCCYLGMEGRVTIGDLVQHFTENYPHVDPMALRLNFATVKWEEPPTPEDEEKRRQQRVEHARRKEHWERETYDRLKAKFEGAEDSTNE